MTLPPFPTADAEALIALALAEDLGDRFGGDSLGDVTSELTIPAEASGRVAIVSRETGRLAGLPIAAMVAARVDAAITVSPQADDGAAIEPGRSVCELSGPVRSLLAAERTILNFLTHLCGVATAAGRYADAVNAVPGNKAVVLDTRKTLPGWRRLAKYAVQCGGGGNHRMGLHDMVLIKDNHLAAAAAASPDQSLAELLAGVRERLPRPMRIEIEVDTLDQLRDALPGGPDIVLLDNMPPDGLREAVAIRDEHAPAALLEASGGITLETIAGVAAAGVDRISVGAITHSVRTLDLGFDWVA